MRAGMPLVPYILGSKPPTEYVAPLGSSSLVFNFLFARFLVGTPVTSNDIYVKLFLMHRGKTLLIFFKGTVIVVLGVIGIVAFGSINSGLATETDVTRLTYLWRRGGWLGYFICMTLALLLLLIFTSKLDAILAERADLSLPSNDPGRNISRATQPGKDLSKLKRAKSIWTQAMQLVKNLLESWSGPQDDKQVAWTLGIGWACCGGGLAGGCLVFAKAM